MISGNFDFEKHINNNSESRNRDNMQVDWKSMGGRGVKPHP